MGKLEEEIEVYRSRTKRSAAVYAEATGVVPFGVNSNYRHMDPWPLYMRGAKGSRMWDVDGNEYIDFNMGFGALVAGHSHPLVTAAVKRRAEEGTLFGFEGEEMVPLAKHFCTRFMVDRVKFSMTGLDATLFAVRVARAFTGHRKILKFEGCYHGSHDFLMVSVKPSKAKAGRPKRPNRVPASGGMLPEVLRHTIVAPFNDLEATEALVRRHSDDLAGIILEPIPMNMGFILPHKGFLEGLRRLCDETGSLLIFDEVKTCGKFYGGAQEAFGVEPDLKVLGKAIGGGYPIAAVAGRRKALDIVVPGRVAHAGTFNANPLSVAAAHATLTEVLTPAAMKEASRLGDDLGRGYEEIAADANLPAVVQYMGISGILQFCPKPVVDWRSFLEVDVSKNFAYWLAMVNRGVIPSALGSDEQWTMSVAHTSAEVEAHLEAFKAIAPGVREVGEAMSIIEAV